MNLNYVILYINDMAKAKQFYAETVGMQIWEAHSGPAFITLRLENGAMIGLQDKAASQLPPCKDPTGSVELSFEAEDVDAVWKRWKESGVEMVTEPMNLPFGRYFMAKDPEGHYLSVYRFNR